MDFEELKSEAFTVYMKCCRTFNPEAGTKFSSWVGFKINRHLAHYQREVLKDRLSFTDSLPEGAEPVHKPRPRSALVDRLLDLSPEAREMVQLLIESPLTDDESPKKILEDACRTFRAERGYDETYTKIILHEIKSEIAADK